MTKDSATHATGLRRLLRRLAVGVSGSAIVVVGLILVPLPGPGWAIALAGVALLGTEFSWAERLVREVQRRLAPAAELLRHVPRPWRVAAAYAAVVGGLARWSCRWRCCADDQPAQTLRPAHAAGGCELRPPTLLQE